MTFTRDQVEQLLKPINPKRVLQDGKGHSHVSQQDILAHLIRVFGFGNFDTEVLGCSLIYEQEREQKGRFDVCYRAMVRLTIRDADGREVAHYENGSTATAQNQFRGDAHDLAYKSAISLSIKRAAIALGDQFGLSLYNKGQMTALVMATYVMPAGVGSGSDLQDGIPQQVSLGNDEFDWGAQTEPAEPARGAEKPPSLKDAVASHQATNGAQSHAANEEWSVPGPSVRTQKQSAKLAVLIREKGLQRDEALTYFGSLIGHKLGSTKDLTVTEAGTVIDALEKVASVSPTTGEVDRPDDGAWPDTAQVQK